MPTLALVPAQGGGGISGGSGGGGSGSESGPRRMSPPPRVSLTDASSAALLEACPVHTPLLVPLVLTNTGRGKAMVTVRPLQAFPDGECYISVDTPTVVIRRGESATVYVSVQLLKPGARVDALLAAEVAGGLRLMVLLRALAEVTVFGVRLADVPAVASGRHAAGIPAPLAQLRERLMLDGGAALRTEGIFRLAPAGDEVRRVRLALNEGRFRPDAPTACSGVAAAHMIKVFLRELPQPVLSAVPTEVLLAASTEAECLAAAARLQPPASVVFDWLVDLCAEAAVHEAENRMGAKNLAICLGPNLFVTDEAVNPMEALMTSQKAVNLLHRVIAARMRERGLAAAQPAASPAPISVSGRP
jgi:hypothetical protein